LVELSLTQSLAVRRTAVESASHVAAASLVAAFAALVAFAVVARHAVSLILAGRRHEVRPEPAFDLEAARRKAAARAAALRDFETSRRHHTDLPFALRGAAPTLFDG
ncbi:MAG: hypothetical protein K2Q06_10510, partial [Parvularculaceae bacterium]|nr:hypothetical protein [Parvularculaceae bacterium]